MSYEGDGRGVAAVLDVSLQKMLFVLVGRCTEKRGVRVLLVGKKKDGVSQGGCRRVCLTVRKWAEQYL